MASLYIKDAEANDLAERLARARGLTKTAAVKIALVNELAREPQQRSVHEIVEELRRTSTFPLDDIGVVDKAFWDSLNDEEDD